MTATNPGPSPTSPPPSVPLLPAAWEALLARLLRRSRERWWLIGAYGLVGAVVAGGTAFLMPRSWTAVAALQAEAAAATLAGAPLGSQSVAHFTADLLTTGPVLRRVAAARFPWKGASVPLWTVYGLDREPQELRLAATLKRLRGALQVVVNPRTSVVTLTVEAATPELAAALADTIVAVLDATGMALRQAHLAPQRARRAQLLESAHRELTAAEQALAGFYRQHRVLTNAPALQTEEWRLRRRVEQAQDITVQIRLQEELATVEEATPVVAVIDPAQPPDRPSGPKRRRAALAGFLIGAALALTRLALEKPSAA